MPFFLYFVLPKRSASVFFFTPNQNAANPPAPRAKTATQTITITKTGEPSLPSRGRVSTVPQAEQVLDFSLSPTVQPPKLCSKPTSRVVPQTLHSVSQGAPKVWSGTSRVRPQVPQVSSQTPENTGSSAILLEPQTLHSLSHTAS